MHLKYPRKRDFYTWEELRCLAKALGFRKDLFIKNVLPEFQKEKSNGLSVKILSNMLDIKCLHGDIHRTYNIHDALYNSRVIEKALDMLSNRYLSFQELREVRVAFQLYEHEDMLGLVIDEHVLLRTLKICGRAVSPVKLKQHIKHMTRQVPDRLMLYEFLDLLLLCERDAEVQLQPLQQVNGVDKNNLFKLCDFQAILSTEDQKKIRHLDHLYEQGYTRAGSGHHQELPSWRLLHQDYYVDSNPRVELVSRQQQRSLELCDHLDHSNKKVMHARCGYVGASNHRTVFIDLNDVNRKLKPLSRNPVQFGSHRKEKEEIAENEEGNTQKEQLSKNFELERSSTRTSSESTKIYRDFDGTTSAKMSQTSRARHQGILVTPRDLHNSHVISQNLQWDIETQSQRLKQRTDKQMKEKYAFYYKRLRRYQDSDENTEKEPSSNSKVKELQEANTSLNKSKDSVPVELIVSPRRQVPKRNSIYQSLMERLHKTDSLLDFGEVRIQDYNVSMPPRLVSDSPFLRKQKLSLQFAKKSLEQHDRKRAVQVQKLGTLHSPQTYQHDEHDLGETHVDQVEQLLGKLQEANYVASGRKGFGNQKEFVLA
ncbi:unnamed protein product [Porites lobata]|uniref:Uncharacterized protein n=1 Tax=Porites lobata TaxID=104759 RepID=A0ABN8R844_9CNID|nr:unnamed protein product [Porites lobata]